MATTDPAHDLVRLKLDNRWGAPPLPLGSSATLQVGDPVAVVGHPRAGSADDDDRHGAGRAPDGGHPGIRHPGGHARLQRGSRRR
ncbi:MAG: serine protease [Actinomycetia bacterium]|nr:serine protease [Actinomycetes bacterium]